MRLFKTIRTHWKKSLFFFGASVAGSKYGYNRYCESLLLRQYCQRIQHHSLSKIQSDQPIRQIIVFLNPSSANGKGLKIFKKFALPMLNMSGTNFVIVPTAYEGHVSSLLKYIPERTEALVVAGGDGMLQDAVTAILRNEKCADLPVGYIPIGTNNTFCSRLLKNAPQQSHVDLICQAVVNIVEGCTEKMPVMQVTPSTGNTVYATSYFTWGAIKDAIDVIPRFWWTGGLRTLCGMLRYTLQSGGPGNVTASVDGNVTDLSNITITPSSTSLLKYAHPAIYERGQFLEEVGLAVNQRKHASLLDKLTIGKEAETVDNITIEPLTQSKFYVDGEPVDSRTVTISLLPDSLNMFVPETPLQTQDIKVIPDMPQSVTNVLLWLRNSFS